jgi:lysophospholipase L1-like esterase
MNMDGKFARGGLTALAMAACASLLLVTAASAKPVQRVTAGSRYLALGDSVTFGYQEPTVVPAPNYHVASNFLGYPEMLGAELHLKVANAACPGETSSSFIDTSAPNLGCESAYRKDFPLHVSYTGSQLAYAVKYLRRYRNVRLVSLMIGANDVFMCEASTKDGCASPSEQTPLFAKIAANTRQILSAIRNKAHYRGQLVLVNYYSLNYTNAFITDGSISLNTALDSSAKRFHAVIANGFATFQAAALHSASNTCTAGLLTMLGKPGDCGVHPSYAGQALLAQTVEKAIRL